MSDYTKATNFTSKDTLPTGNANKIVKGTEIDTEFTAIASAITSKANSNDAVLTGAPVAPTASVGTATTQIATTLFVDNERTSTATLTNKTLTSPTINTPTITGGTITGITDLTVADGGTGASSITANSVILGNGSSTLSGNLVAPGTSGNVLTSNGTTWTAAQPSNLGGKGQVFTSSGTFTIPTGVNTIKVTVLGGGGYCQYSSASNGGTSSVASGTQSISTISATGGIGCNFTNAIIMTAGGTGSGGDINLTGGYASQITYVNSSGTSGQTGLGGSAPLGLGVGGWKASGLTPGYGGGGSAIGNNDPFYGVGGSTGSGGAAIKYLTGLTPANTLTVTVGNGGTGSALGTGNIQGQAGGQGLVIIEW